MIPVKYWNIWAWLQLVVAIWNAVSFITMPFGLGAIVSLVFAVACGYFFWENVKR